MKKFFYKIIFWSSIIVGVVLITIFSYCAWGTLYGLVQDLTNTFWAKLIGLLLLGGLIFSDIRLSVKLIRLKKNNETNRGLSVLTMLAFALTFTLLLALCCW